MDSLRYPYLQRKKRRKKIQAQFSSNRPDNKTSTMAYQDSPKTEGRQALLRDSESSSSTVDEEKPMQWGTSTSGDRAARWSTPSEGRTFLSAMRECAWLVTIGLMAVIVVLQLAIWHEVRGAAGSGAASSATTPGGDYTGKGPMCSLITTTTG